MQNISHFDLSNCWIDVSTTLRSLLNDSNELRRHLRNWKDGERKDKAMSRLTAVITLSCNLIFIYNKKPSIKIVIMLN